MNVPYGPKCEPSATEPLSTEGAGSKLVPTGRPTGGVNVGRKVAASIDLRSPGPAVCVPDRARPFLLEDGLPERGESHVGACQRAVYRIP